MAVTQVITRPPYCGYPAFDPRTLFERDPAGGLGVPFENSRVALCANARAGIRKACDVLGIGRGHAVLAPAYNCGSEIDALLDSGAEVEMYPVDRETRIDPKEVEKRITPRTRAIYLTHYFGFYQTATPEIRRICCDRGLFLIEDRALRLFDGNGVALKDIVGDAAVFSFPKFFPLPAGGALVVSSENLVPATKFDRSPPPGVEARVLVRAGLAVTLGQAGAERVLSLLKKVWRGGSAMAASYDSSDEKALSALPDMPTRYYFDPRLKDAQIGFISRRALRAFNIADAIAARRANYASYLRHLAGVPRIRLLFPDLPDGACPCVVPIILPDRDAVAAELIGRGIAATAWWSGYHRRLSWADLPDARFLKDHVLALPLHQFMDERHVDYIVGEVKRLTSLM